MFTDCVTVFICETTSNTRIEISPETRSMEITNKAGRCLFEDSYNSMARSRANFARLKNNKSHSLRYQRVVPGEDMRRPNLLKNSKIHRFTREIIDL